MGFRALFYIEQNYAYAVLRPLQAEILRRGGEVRWFLVGEEVCKAYLRDNEQQMVNIAAIKHWRPQAVFVPGDRVPSFVPGLKVQVFHGLNESKRGNEYPERGLFDLYCTEGYGRTSTLQALAEKRGYFKVVETGWIKLDNLFNPEVETFVDFTPGQQYTRPQILFASTFTPSLSCAESVFDEIQRLSCDDAWQWLVTLHPKMDDKVVQKYRQLENKNLRFFDNDRVIELLHRADLMVSDNSSILQEFLLLKKPVVTVNNRDPQACFININKPNQLVEAICAALAPEQMLVNEISAYAASVTPYLDGLSSARVLDAVFEMLSTKPNGGVHKKKPRNIFRNFKMRRQLSYWGR